MLELIAEVQKVELVDGGGNWLSQNANTFVLAIAAFLAASVAMLNVSRQLRSDRQNQRDELTHDRMMRNRDYIRDTIEAGATLAGDARIAIDNALETTQALDSVRDELDAGAGAGEMINNYEIHRRGLAERLGKRIPPAREHLAAMREMILRLELRLDPEHGIVTTYKTLREALSQALDNLAPALRDARSQESRESDGARQEKVEAAFGGFRAACYEWFNE